MIFIGLCALAAAVIIIERFLFFFSIKKEDAALVPVLKDYIRKKDFDEARTFCAASSSPLAKLSATALESLHRGEQAIPEMVQFAASREIPRIERYISSLGTIANIATLLGLLGTVLGNIGAFGILAESGVVGDPSLLAGAIAEALITTAAGLIVSIPATIFYNYFAAKANQLITEMETFMGELLLLMKAETENHAE